MRPSWEALVARARGLSTHLLPDDRLQRLERATTLAELTDALGESRYLDFVGGGEAAPAALDQGVTHLLARRMAMLARWAGPDDGALTPLFIEQDARNLRDILRGLVGALTPAERTANAIPTPQLGGKQLLQLARLDSPAAVAAKLDAWDHPLGAALLEETGASRPDLFRLETALERSAAAVAGRSARKGGRRMRAFVRESIDARNAVTAILLVGVRAEGESADYFVEGGGTLPLGELVRAAASPDRASAAESLAASSPGTPLAEALRGAPARPAALAARILEARIAAYTKLARQDPVSALPVVLFVLRLRREVETVRRAFWAAALAGGRGR